MESLCSEKYRPTIHTFSTDQPSIHLVKDQPSIHLVKDWRSYRTSTGTVDSRTLFGESEECTGATF